MKKKLLSAMLAASFVFTSMAGMGALTAEAATAKDTLKVAVNMDAPGFDPYTSGYNVSSALICRNVYETLINMDTEGNLYPGLATEWEWGKDNMSVILTLREGVKFSNGEDFNADSVIYALRDYRGKTAVGGDGESLYDFDNMTKVDDFKVEIPLKRAGSDAFITLADQMYSIVSKQAAEEFGDNYPNNPVGTGPYKFVSFTSGVGAEMEANEDYWDGAPEIKHVQTVLISEGSQAEIELENGNIDLVTNPDDMDVDRILRGDAEGLKTIDLPSANCKMIWFNFRKEAMRDANLRRAINCAIDKEAIIEVAYGGFGTVANQMIANTNGAYDPAYDEEPMYTYDVEKAKEYLAQSNYPEGLTINIYSDTTPAEVRIMECVKNDLAQIGIDVEINALDSNVAVPALIQGEEDDMYVAISCSSPGYAPGYLKNASPNMTPSWGAWELTDEDAAINDLYVQALAATDADECNDLVRQAVKLEMEGAMAVPVCYTIGHMTCADNFEGMEIGGGNAVYWLKDAYFAE